MDSNDSTDLHGQDFSSLPQAEDSNALILPQKKKNKRKRATKDLVGAKSTKLSKSQKRKLRKLEEVREAKLRLKKTFEDLERYKIKEELFPLLRSSKNIGQNETKLEKRRRSVQYFKAGLELPSDDKCMNVKEGDGSSHDTGPGFNQDQTQDVFYETQQGQSMVEDREVHSDSFDSLVSAQQQIAAPSNEICGASDQKLPDEEISTLDNAMSAQENLPISHVVDAISGIKPPDGNDQIERVDFRTTTKHLDCPLDKPLTAPIVVHVSRPKAVDEKRKDLPIVMMEQEIMEAVSEHSTVIICGETGCGKTTQVPQFLYEAGYGSKQSIVRSGIIGVTQPRRVAVLATAKRVSHELGLRLGKDIGFQVRYDKKVGDNCSIKFMTDGILLREVQSDILLKCYSVIILDEAHERSLNTDILIGMLSRVMQIRQKIFEDQQQKMLIGVNISREDMVFPLKVVLMSATMRVEDFVSGRRIFHHPPPVIEVPARQFPVSIHFSKRTEVVDYIGQAYKKVLSIHRRLPPGGILVFVTGQREVEYLCQKLRKASRDLIMRNSRTTGVEVNVMSDINSDAGINMNEINEAFDIRGTSDHQQTDRFSSYDEGHGDLDEDESGLSYDSQTDSDLEVEDDDIKTSLGDANFEDVLGEEGSLASLKAAFEALTGKATANRGVEGEQVTQASSDGCTNENVSNSVKGKSGENAVHAGAMCVLPLYAMLPAAAQLRVFEEIKEGERLVVVATNVAETSLTIPGIKYVVDSGREKVKNYNSSNGMETFEVQWISKASAAQRAGRAGRTGPGHCYRLYSSAVFSNIFPDFSVAEISKIPVDGVVLLMKSMGIGKVSNFPFPTPPQAAALVEAERCLKTLEALDSNGRLTSMGMAMARYPMSPRHSRMLLTVIQLMREVKNYARAGLVLGYAVAAAAALSLSNPFIMRFEGSHSNKDDEKPDVVESQNILSKEEKLRKKKLKETLKVSRAKFSNPSSDALAIAYALQCFELSGSPVEFCSENGLQLKTMEEMSKLRKQLLQLVFGEHGGYDLQQEFFWTHGTMEDVECAWRSSSDKHPLLLNEEEILCQAICAGWADRIARRSRRISCSAEGDRKANAVRYQACMVKESVFLHRWSSLSNSAPEFLVYNELMHTKRPYMHGATSVKSNWLVKYARSLCTFSAPLTDPKPYYECLSDQVFSWVAPTFGPHLWELPLHNLPISNSMERVAVFACALLEGQVLPCLTVARRFMAAAPSIILRPEAFGQRRVGNLLSKFNSRLRTVDSCAMLREAWEENPMEFRAEILDWFQASFHCQFDKLWSKMHQEVVQEPQERFPKKIKKMKKMKNGRKLLA